MSTAQLVPESRGLDGDDARMTSKRIGTWSLLKRSAQRFRYADGFSHARSLGFLIALVAVQGLIAVVGLATALSESELASVIARTIEGVVPGPAGETLSQSLEQATTAGTSRRYTALLVGLAGAIVTGTTAFGQIERGANRLYGVEKDRPTLAKYGRALMLALTAGVAGTAAFVMLSVGSQIGDAIENDTADSVWAVARWPLGLVLLVAAVTLIFKLAPRREQPELSWMVVGGALSVLAWFAVSMAMSLFLESSGSFGDTYGPLAGLVALLLWSFFSGISLFAGLAVAAQLEAERAHLSEPESAAKLAASDPDILRGAPAMSGYSR
jgi:YihY family inner membrane protein